MMANANRRIKRINRDDNRVIASLGNEKKTLTIYFNEFGFISMRMQKFLLGLRAKNTITNSYRHFCPSPFFVT